jgi:hypothetical protein
MQSKMLTRRGSESRLAVLSSSREVSGFWIFTGANRISITHQKITRIMPTVFTRKGYGEAVFNVEGDVELRESVGLKVKELWRAEELAREQMELILTKWNEHFN